MGHSSNSSTGAVIVGVGGEIMAVKIALRLRWLPDAFLSGTWAVWHEAPCYDWHHYVRERCFIPPIMTVPGRGNSHRGRGEPKMGGSPYRICSIEHSLEQSKYNTKDKKETANKRKTRLTPLRYDWYITYWYSPRWLTPLRYDHSTLLHSTPLHSTPLSTNY